ncbi:MAG: 50S ribosomal protein L10 [Parachlamydiales bacterium]|nr:50S ribosomal protein L10 [Parachlamydiales bacterium]
MRKEKPLLLDEIKEKIDGSKAMIIASYDKLEPNTSWAFRDLLGKSGSQFEVVKKRVFLKAAEKSGVKIDEALLKGHVGVVFISGDDAMVPAKAVFKFSEENGNILQVVCGQVEGKLVPGSELEELSKLPGIDEMRAIMLGLFTSPMSQMLSVIEAALAGPLSVINEKSES